METENVDNTKINTVEWFFGYGGNHIGLKRVLPNLRLRAVCERDGFVIANMVSKMEKGLLDPVPIWSDCKTFPAEPFKDRTDLFIASYPCQAFSGAGKRLGKEDPRHLWPYVRLFVQRARPRFCFFENVEGHVSLGLSTVLSDLEEDGYKTSWGIFSAKEVGAAHLRKRVFILARHKSFNGRGLSVRKETSHTKLGNRCNNWPSGRGEEPKEWEPQRILGNAGSEKSHRLSDKQRKEISEVRITSIRETKPAVGRDINGLADGMDYAELSRLSNQELGQICSIRQSTDNRTDELRMCGNGVVPATAAKAFKILYAEIIK